MYDNVFKLFNFVIISKNEPTSQRRSKTKHCIENNFAKEPSTFIRFSFIDCLAYFKQRCASLQNYINTRTGYNGGTHLLNWFLGHDVVFHAK